MLNSAYILKAQLMKTDKSTGPLIMIFLKKEKMLIFG